MTGKPNGKHHPPMGTIEAAWREYRKWAAVSRAMKSKEKRLRHWAASLGLGGAALGALAADLGSDFAFAGVAAGSASAGLVGLATYLGQLTLAPDGERAWARARSLAEALKREVWLCLLSVPPYDDELAGSILEKRVEKFFENTAPVLSLSFDAVSEGEPPRPTGVDDYIRDRLRGQIEWYGKRARELVGKVTTWKRASAVMGVAASASGLSVLTRFGLTSWVPVLTTAAAAVASYVAAERYQTLIPLYRDTERQLRFRLARWENSSEDERTVEAARALVRDSEDIMARENESWRAEWTAEDASS